MTKSTTLRRGLAGLLTLLLVGFVTYQGPVQADETDGGFSVDDFAGNSIGTRALVGGAQNQCGWTDRNSMTMGSGTMRIDLRVPDSRGCHFAAIGVKWTAPTSVNIQQGGADRIILKYRDVLPATPSAVVFGLELVDVNGRTASVGGLSRNGGAAGDFLTIRYAPAYVGDVSYLTFQGGFDKSRVKSITLTMAATQSDTNVSVTFEGIGTNVGEPAYMAPSFSTAAAYEFPANTSTTHSFTVTGLPAPDVTWTGKPAWMTITTAPTTGGRQVTMSGNPGTAYADHSIAFHANVANSLTADAAVRAVVPSPVVVTTTSGDRLVGQAGPFTVGTVNATPAATSITNVSNTPPGTTLAISGTSIVLTGTPTTPGTYAMSATVGNEFRSAAFARDIVIGALPQITVPAIQYLIRGESMTPFTPVVTGYPEPTVSITGLPNGLTATGGQVSGVPTTTSTTTVTVLAENAFGSDEDTFDIAVGDRPTLDVPSALDATAGTPIDVHLSTTGDPTSVAVTGLPAGLAATLSAGVVEIIGTPLRPTSVATASGTATISVSNAFGSASHDLPWTVSAAPLITGITSAASTVGATVTPIDITVSGYPAPTVTITDPDADGTLLPPGLVIDDSVAGVVTVSGAPTGPGTQTVRITANNGVGVAAVHDLTITALTIPTFAESTQQLSVVQNATETLTIAATGFPPPFLTLTTTTPSWITFDPATGTVTASPDATVSGLFGPYRIQATNGAGSTGVDVFVEVKAPPGISATTPAPLPFGSAVNAAVATVSGYPLPTVTATGLPDGLSLTQSGSTVSLAGTPTGAGGTYTAVLTATNGVGTAASTTVAVTVMTPPTITAPASATIHMGESTSLAPTIGGFPRPMVIATGLPSGMVLDPVTGEISGTPWVSGTYNVTLTTLGGAADFPSASTTIAILVAVPPFFVSVPTQTTYTVDTPVPAADIIAFGYPEPTIIVSGLPAGLTSTLTGNVLTVLGTPTESGVYPVIVTATNAGGTVHAEWEVTVNEVPEVHVPASADLLYGEPITPIPVSVTGYPAPTVTATALPPGLSIESDGNGTRIVGTPTALGHFSSTVSASSVAGTASQVIEIEVGSAPVLGADQAVAFQAGLATTIDVPLTGAPAPVITTTALPAWLSFDAAALRFTAAPLAADAGTSGTVTVTAISAFGSDEMDLEYDVTLAPGTSVSTGSRTITSGTSVTDALATVTGYPTPSVIANGLPAGLHLDIVGGDLVLSGSTSNAGSHDVTVTLTNGVGSDAVSQWTIDVNEAAGLSVPTDRTLTIGAPVTLAVSATGYPAPTLTVTGLPQGLTWTPTAGGGIISGSPTAEEVATVTVTASNASGPDAIAQFTLTTALATISVSSGADDVPAGSQVSVSASGFQPGEMVTIELHSTPVLLTSLAANGAGEVHTTVTIPASTEPGSHQLVVTGATGATGSSPLRVHVRAALASTGDSTSTTGPLAAALILAGLALMVVRRSSRPE